MSLGHVVFWLLVCALFGIAAWIWTQPAFLIGTGFFGMALCQAMNEAHRARR